MEIIAAARLQPTARWNMRLVRSLFFSSQYFAFRIPICWVGALAGCMVALRDVPLADATLSDRCGTKRKIGRSNGGVAPHRSVLHSLSSLSLLS